MVLLKFYKWNVCLPIVEKNGYVPLPAALLARSPIYNFS